MRTFEDTPATREQTPLLIGLVGASGSGKTFSALRLAAGIQRVAGGDVFFIDTEARRALAYADRFAFRHLAFAAPFGPLDYLAAVDHCVRKGAKTVVIDSMSHEHEGPGGVLEMHAAEVHRMAGNDFAKAEKVKMLAWQRPKSERRRLLNTLLQMPTNLIFCFRAKEKIKILPGKTPQPLGWMPIAGEEFVYEMSLNCLLYPGSNGVPTWNPGEVGERSMVKLPIQFREMFSQPRPLDEGIGESLARWAVGEGDGSDEGGPERWNDDQIRSIAKAAIEDGKLNPEGGRYRTIKQARAGVVSLWGDRIGREYCREIADGRALPESLNQEPAISAESESQEPVFVGANVGDGDGDDEPWDADQARQPGQDG